MMEKEPLAWDLIINFDVKLSLKITGKRKNKINLIKIFT